eukprot:jgi/Galph1/2201/GphlegSOOS_G892.1
MDPKCEICQKAVYMAEKVTVDENKAYHMGCFRCSTCKVKLSLGNYTLLDGVLFCKPHFHEAFLSTGTYRAPEHNKLTNKEESTENASDVVNANPTNEGNLAAALNENESLPQNPTEASQQPVLKENPKSTKISQNNKQKDDDADSQQDAGDDENVDPRHRHNLRSVLRSGQKKIANKRDGGLLQKGKRANSLLQNSNGGSMRSSLRLLQLSQLESGGGLDAYDLVEDISVVSTMLKEHQKEISAIRAALNRIQENLETL